MLQNVLSPTIGGGLGSVWSTEQIGQGSKTRFWLPGSHLTAFWGVLASACPLKRGSKMGFPQSDPGPLGVTVDVFSARFEAYLGYFDRLYVPKSLKGEPFETQKG